MKQLLASMQKSIYGPEYYREILARPMSYSWKYYWGVALLLAVFLTIISSIPIIMGLNRFMHEFPPKFFSYFPDALEITIAKGHVSTNMSEPYVFPIPPEMRSMMKDGHFASLAVIDTGHPFSTEQFDTEKSVLWIGATQIAWRDADGKVTIQPLPETMNYTINEAHLHALEARIAPYYSFIPPATVVIIFLGLLLALSINIFYLIFGALLIWLLGFLMKQRFTYAKSYQIGLHALTLPVLLNTLLAMSSFAFLRVPFAFSFLMLIMVYINFKDMSPSSTPSIVSDPAEVSSVPEK